MKRQNAKKNLESRCQIQKKKKKKKGNNVVKMHKKKTTLNNIRNLMSKIVKQNTLLHIHAYIYFFV